MGTWLQKLYELKQISRTLVGSESELNIFTWHRSYHPEYSTCSRISSTQHEVSREGSPQFTSIWFAFLLLVLRAFPLPVFASSLHFWHHWNLENQRLCFVHNFGTHISTRIGHNLQEGMYRVSLVLRTRLWAPFFSVHNISMILLPLCLDSIF